MATCPACGDEFEDGVEVCPDDGTPLVDADDAHGQDHPVGAPVEAGLGTFHPRMAVELRRLLELRGQPHRLVEVDELRTEVRVPADDRDELRAELVLGWNELLRVLPADAAPGVLGVGTSTHPGWHDAPQGAWVDREGRLRVAGADDEALADAQRNLGPALVGGGVVVGLLAWATGGSELGYLLAGIALVLGVLLPR